MRSGSIKQSRGHRASQFGKGQNTEEVATFCLASRGSFSSLLRWGRESQVLVACDIPGCMWRPACLEEVAKQQVPFQDCWDIPLALLFLPVNPSGGAGGHFSESLTAAMVQDLLSDR